MDTTIPRNQSLLKALKRRHNRLTAMEDLVAKGVSPARIGRRLRVTLPKLRSMLEESRVFNEELGLCWRIHWYEVPGTKRPGDKRAYARRNARLNALMANGGGGYTGRIADATLADAWLRAQVVATIISAPTDWEKL